MALKVFKTPAQSGTFAIDFSALVSSVQTITSVTSSPSGLVITNSRINSTDYEGILANKGVLLDISSGANGYEYIITVKVNNEIEVSVVLVVLDKIPLKLDYYGNILEATTYFNNKLNNDSWFSADNPKQRISLIEATKLVDKLYYYGSKLDSNQILQFPRDDQTDVPAEVLYATFEIAQCLLSGKDVDSMLESNPVVKDKYGSVETEYDPRFRNEHQIAGIPSALAWSYLKPYFGATRALTFNRVS